MRKLSLSTRKIVIYRLRMFILLTFVYFFSALTFAQEANRIPTVLIVSPKNTVVTQSVRDSLVYFRVCLLICDKIYLNKE